MRRMQPQTLQYSLSQPLHPLGKHPINSKLQAAKPPTHHLLYPPPRLLLTTLSLLSEDICKSMLQVTNRQLIACNTPPPLATPSPLHRQPDETSGDCRPPNTRSTCSGGCPRPPPRGARAENPRWGAPEPTGTWSRTGCTAASSRPPRRHPRGPSPPPQGPPTGRCSPSSLPLPVPMSGAEAEVQDRGRSSRVLGFGWALKVFQGCACDVPGI